MAVLGYNTKDSADTSGLSAAGRMYVSKFTLASAQVMSELHGWFHSDGFGSTTIRLVIYADSAGAPAARVAFTAPLALTTAAGDYELSQTGFSVALAAGDYWIGWSVGGTVGGSSFAFAGTAGTHTGKTGGAADPPDNPFGSTGTSGTRKHSCWAVVNPAVSVPVADFTGTPLTGTAPYTVTFTDASTNTPTSWAWTFGDGGTSSSQNPTHSYTAAGTYTVVLVATNAAGSNTKTRTAYVTVAAGFVPQIIMVN